MPRTAGTALGVALVLFLLLDVLDALDALDALDLVGNCFSFFFMSVYHLPSDFNESCISAAFCRILYWTWAIFWLAEDIFLGADICAGLVQ